MLETTEPQTIAPIRDGYFGWKWIEDVEGIHNFPNWLQLSASSNFNFGVDGLGWHVPEYSKGVVNRNPSRPSSTQDVPPNPKVKYGQSSRVILACGPLN